MTVTIDVIRDLLPAYHSGEASEDTRRLVDRFLEEHPEHAPEVRAWLAGLAEADQAGAAMPPPDGERRALARSKRILRWQQLWLALASTFTLNALTLGFSFRIDGSRVRLQWMALPGQPTLVVVVALVAIVFWAIYLRSGNRIRTRILG